MIVSIMHPYCTISLSMIGSTERSSYTTSSTTSTSVIFMLSSSSGTRSQEIFTSQISTTVGFKIISFISDGVWHWIKCGSLCLSITPSSSCIKRRNSWRKWKPWSCIRIQWSATFTSKTSKQEWSSSCLLHRYS